MLKKLIAIAGLAGTLGVAAPAFADWHRPGPVVVRPAPVYRPIYRPAPVARPGYYGYGYGYRPVYRPGWEARRWEWRHHHRYYRGW
jgi:hypothetical protein